MRPLPNLKAIRERAFLTQEQLAARSGVSETTISRVENEHHAARFSTIAKLAKALCVRPQELTEATP